MSKSLTIEELKALPVGEWVWVTYNGHHEYNEYIQKSAKSDDKKLKILNLPCAGNLIYQDYGTKWLAYKNKEQAEAAEYKIDFDEQGGWEIRKYIPAHYQPWCTAESEEEAENIIKQLRGEK